MSAKSGEPDRTPRYAASDLDLHCLRMSHKKDSMLKWVKNERILFSRMECTSLETCAIICVTLTIKFVILFKLNGFENCLKLETDQSIINVCVILISVHQSSR